MAESLDTEIKTTHNEAYELIKQEGEQTPHEEHENELVCSVPMKQKKVSQKMHLSSTSHATQALYYNVTLQDSSIGLQPLCHQHQSLPKKEEPLTSKSTKPSSVHRTSKQLKRSLSQITPKEFSILSHKSRPAPSGHPSTHYYQLPTQDKLMLWNTLVKMNNIMCNNRYVALAHV